MTQFRLPAVNSDDGTWGDILLQWLKKEHYDSGIDDGGASNGGHKNVTIRGSTTGGAGTAPLKFASGTILTTPESGAMEFNTDTLYFTITTGTVRKKVAIYDDSSGSAGDIYYRDGSGVFKRLPIGSTGQALTVSGSGAPSWSTGTGTFATNTKTSSYTVTATDTVILADASTANVTITLPAATSLPGYRFYIKRIDTAVGNTVTINTSSGNIDGGTSLTIGIQYGVYELVSNGAVNNNWYVISTNVSPVYTTSSGSSIALRSTSTTAVQNTAAAVVGNKPSGVIAGDVMIAYFTAFPGTTSITISPPSGWTAIGNPNSYTTADQITSQAFYKVAGNSEPSTYSFTSVPAKPCDIAIMAFTGVDNNSPVHYNLSQTSGTGLTRTTGGFNLNGTGKMLLFMTSGFTGAISSGPTYNSVAMDQLAVYDAQEYIYMTHSPTTSGPTGTVSATQSLSDSWTVDFIALNPISSLYVTGPVAGFKGEVDVSDYLNVTGTANFDNDYSWFGGITEFGGNVIFDPSSTVNFNNGLVAPTGDINVNTGNINVSAGSLIVSASSIYSRGIDMGLGIIAAPLSTTVALNNVGATELLDTNIGVITFTAVAGRRYRAVLTGRGFNGTTVGDRYVVNFRDGGSSTPTNTSTNFGTNWTVPIAVAGTVGVDTHTFMTTKVLTAGTHKIGVFVLRSNGSGTASFTGSCEFYIEDIGAV